MSPEYISTLAIQAIKVAASLAGPLLFAALIIGLIISLLQAATQINEMTLSFIPKIVAVVMVLIIAGPWMLSVIVDYIRILLTDIPNLTN